jgi:hypothetical protein
MARLSNASLRHIEPIINLPNVDAATVTLVLQPGVSEIYKPGPPYVVKDLGSSSTSPTPAATVTLNAPNGGGTVAQQNGLSMIVVLMTVMHAAAPSGNPTLTDSAGNSYYPTYGTIPGTNARMMLWTCYRAKFWSAAPTFSLYSGGPNITGVILHALEISGPDTIYHSQQSYSGTSTAPIAWSPNLPANDYVVLQFHSVVGNPATLTDNITNSGGATVVPAGTAMEGITAQTVAQKIGYSTKLGAVGQYGFNGTLSTSSPWYGTSQAFITGVEFPVVQLTLTPSSIEAVALVDTNTEFLVFVPSAVEVPPAHVYSDSTTAAIAFTVSSAELPIYADSASEYLGFVPSAAEVIAPVDSSTVSLKFTPGVTESVALVDANSASITFAPSATEVIQLTDSAAVGVVFTPTAIEYRTVTYVDAATVALALTPSGFSQPVYVDDGSVAFLDMVIGYESFHAMDDADVGVVLFAASSQEFAAQDDGDIVVALHRCSAQEFAGLDDGIEVIDLIAEAVSEEFTYYDDGILEAALIIEVDEYDPFFEAPTAPLLFTIGSIEGVIRFPTTGILDSFNRANGPLGSNWTVPVFTALPGAPKIVSNQFAPDADTGNDYCSAYWNPATFGPDCEIYTTIASLANSNKIIEMYLRMTGMDGTPSGYSLFTSDFSSWSINRYDNGAFTQLGTFSGGIIATDSVGFSARGNVLTFWAKTASGPWNYIFSVTDTNYNVAGYIGMAILAGTAPGVNRFDDLGGGTYAPGVVGVDADTVLLTLTHSGVETPGTGGTAYTDSATEPLVLTPSSTEVLFAVDANTASLVFTPSAVEVYARQLQDADTIAFKFTPSAAEVGAFVDASTASVITTPATADVLASTDAQTANVVFTTSGVDVLVLTDAATESLKFTVSGVEVYTALGDAAVIPLTFTESAAEVLVAVDAATEYLTFGISGVEVYTRPAITDAATIPLVLTPSSTEIHELYDTAVGNLTFTPAGADTLFAVDSSTEYLRFGVTTVEQLLTVDLGVVSLVFAVTSTDIAIFADATTETLVLTPGGTEVFVIHVEVGIVLLKFTVTGIDFYLPFVALFYDVYGVAYKRYVAELGQPIYIGVAFKRYRSETDQMRFGGSIPFKRWWSSAPTNSGHNRAYSG